MSSLSPTDDLRKIKADISLKRSEMTIQQAYERFGTVSEFFLTYNFFSALDSQRK